MRYLVYILESEKNGRYYIGFSRDIETRLLRHNQGKVKATKYIRPLRVVYTEGYESAAEARKRERYLKSLKSRTALQTLIQQRGPLAQVVRAQS